MIECEHWVVEAEGLGRVTMRIGDDGIALHTVALQKEGNEEGRRRRVPSRRRRAEHAVHEPRRGGERAAHARARWPLRRADRRAQARRPAAAVRLHALRAEHAPPRREGGRRGWVKHIIIFIIHYSLFNQSFSRNCKPSGMNGGASVGVHLFCGPLYSTTIVASYSLISPIIRSNLYFFALSCLRLLIRT